MSVTTWRVLTKDCLFVFIFIEFYTSPIFAAEIFENSQFISSGEVATLSVAHRWCLNHSSQLVEITSEELWEQTEAFVRNFSLTDQYQYILNIVGKELPAWQWITGTNFNAARKFKGLEHDGERYAHLSQNLESEIIIERSQPDYGDGTCLLPYICEYNSTPAISKCDNATSVSFEGSCYVFHEHERVSWFGAYHACKKNNGRLATFRTIPRNESNFLRKLTTGRPYWIGLFRHKWSWKKSGDLLTFTNWDRTHLTQYGGSSLRVDPYTREWLPVSDVSTTVSSTFVCLKDAITTMAPTSTAAKTTTPPPPTTTTTPSTTTSKITTTKTTTSKTRTTVPTTTSQKTTPSPRTTKPTTTQKQETISSASQLTTAGLSTETTMSETNEKHFKLQEDNPNGQGMEMRWIFLLAGGILLVAVAIFVVFVCVMKKNKSAKPNDTKQSNQNKTSNTSALDYARVNYSEVNGSDRNGNKESKKATTSDHGNPIYGQVINRPDEDRTEPAQSSLVYADLEFIQKSIKDGPTYSNQELKTQPPSLKTGPMGDVYAMVQK